MARIIKRFILTLSILLIGVNISLGCDDDKWCCYDNDREGKCEASGYEPGGGKVILEPIEAPVAELEEKGIAQIAKYGGFATTIVGDVVDVFELVDKFAGVAEKLSVGLGIWGHLLGGVLSFNSPTPQDIIDACNKALAELTKEVNDQFTNMEAYVDHEILQLQEDMMNYDYQKYHNYFSNCINEVTAEKVNDCMEEAERLSGADYKKFMQFVDHVYSKEWEPTPDDIKKMEIQFLTFRDFAQLRVMELLTLAGTYKDMDSDYAKNQTKRYFAQLKTETVRYLNYSTFCFNHIHKMHNPNDQYITEMETCGGTSEQWEGGKHTRNWRTCETLFSPMLISTEVCKEKAGVRMDGKCPTSECQPWKPDPQQYSGETIKQYIVKVRMWPYFDDYRTKMVTSVDNYWKPQIYNRLTAWKEIYSQIDGLMEQGGYSKMAAPPEDYLTDTQRENIAAAQEAIVKAKEGPREKTKDKQRNSSTNKKTEL